MTKPLTKHKPLLTLEKTTAELSTELSQEQLRLLERFSPEFRERQIQTRHTGHRRHLLRRPSQGGR